MKQLRKKTNDDINTDRQRPDKCKWTLYDKMNIF